MDFGKAVLQALQIVWLNAATVRTVAHDQNATLPAFLIPALGGVLGSVVLAIFGYSPAAVLVDLVVGVLASMAGVVGGTAVLYVTSLLFDGKAGFMELLRPMGHAGLLGWLSVLMVVPVFGVAVFYLAMIWSIVVDVVIVKNVGRLSTVRAVAVVLIPLFVLSVLLFFLLGAAFLVMMSRPH
ncbi:hypothetical protein HY489_00695 [Candidatus Woesearchaeota archaeon]|nr:hypothetical protein [Candidatus Woesearchaeota archaeon]